MDGEPRSPKERLKKYPLLLERVATATGPPIAKKASPGCAAITNTFEKSRSCEPEVVFAGRPGNWATSKNSLLAERATAPRLAIVRKSRRVGDMARPAFHV